jgi:hypothetical protein
MSLLIALALSAAPPARIQPQAPASPSDAIVVEGHIVKDQAADYVDKVLPTSFAGQFGRFEDPICPKTIGLAEPLSREVIERIQLVSRTVGIRVDQTGCTPNLVLIVAPDKKAMIQTLRKSRPSYVNGLSAAELDRQANSPRPFAAWQMVEVFAADGMHIGSGDNMPTGSNGARDPKTGAIWTEGDFPRTKTTVTPSRLRANTKPHVLVSLVIVENGALRGATARQLADFAFVRGVTPIVNGRSDPPSSSILGLFNDGVTPESGPQSLTWWDVAFLKSLVDTRSDALANVQRNEIRNQMIKEVEKAPVAER